MSGSTIKLLALFFMLLDHIIKVFFYDIVYAISYPFAWDMNIVQMVLSCIGALGSISFILYAAMCAEGCRYTSNKVKYLSLLLLFAFISEPFYQILVALITEDALILEWGCTNIFFTLFLGAAGCFAFRKLQGGYKGLLVLLLLALCAMILDVDYGAFGVVVIFTAFLVEDRKLRLTALSILVFLFYFSLIAIPSIQGGYFFLEWPYVLSYLVFSQISIVLLAFYNGKRGRKLKWFFYLSYPVHIFLIDFIYMSLHSLSLFIY